MSSGKLGPLSSDAIIAALKAAGFEPVPKGRSQRRKKGGSHRTYKRLRADGRHDVCTVPIGKREVPDGTLSSILRQANMTKTQFREFL